MKLSIVDSQNKCVPTRSVTVRSRLLKLRHYFLWAIFPPIGHVINQGDFPDAGIRGDIERLQFGRGINLDTRVPQLIDKLTAETCITVPGGAGQNDCSEFASILWKAFCDIGPSGVGKRERGYPRADDC
jgi:hypothetical protein